MKDVLVKDLNLLEKMVVKIFKFKKYLNDYLGMDNKNLNNNYYKTIKLV